MCVCVSMVVVAADVAADVVVAADAADVAAVVVVHRKLRERPLLLFT